MGIRVVCPNGHRLHLKTQLAGRRGLCPKCGARFRIPSESSDQPQPFAEPPLRPAGGVAIPTATAVGPASSTASRSTASHSTASVAPTTQTHAAQPPLGAAAIPMAMPVASAEPVQPAAIAQPAPVGQPNAANGAAPAIPVPQVPTQTPAVGPPVTPAPPVDPLSATPQASWFVQPPTGGRYGPAKADVMRQWIVEGRITDDCLIWRDGWSEWQSASTILGSGSTGEAPVDNGVPADFQPGSGSISSRRRSKRSKGFGVSMIIILGLACLGLLALLFVLISNGTISLAPSLPVE